MFHGHLDSFFKSLLGGRPTTKLGDHGTPNVHNRWFVLFYRVWRSTWIDIHWNSIWLRARSRMTSHYTWGYVTTLDDFGGVLGRPLDTFLWVLTISSSRLSTRVWSGLKSQLNWGQSEQSQPLRAWRLGLSTWHGSQVLSPKYDMDCLHDNTFWRWGLGLVLRVGSTKKLDPTFNTIPNVFA